MAATMNGTFDLSRVVRVVEARKGNRKWGKLAQDVGIDPRQMTRIKNAKVRRPQSGTLSGLEEAVGLPAGTLTAVGEGRMTVEDAIAYGREPGVHERLARHEDELAEVRRLLSDVLRRLDAR